jgi:hypothetical protein
MALTRDEILAQMADKAITLEEAGKLLDELQKANMGHLYCKVSQKQAMSLYGLQRMPVTLYVEQWERLLAFADDIRDFLKDHKTELKRKTRPAA